MRVTSSKLSERHCNFHHTHILIIPLKHKESEHHFVRYHRHGIRMFMGGWNDTRRFPVLFIHSLGWVNCALWDVCLFMCLPLTASYVKQSVLVKAFKMFIWQTGGWRTDSSSHRNTSCISSQVWHDMVQRAVELDKRCQGEEPYLLWSERSRWRMFWQKPVFYDYLT